MRCVGKKHIERIEQGRKDPPYCGPPDHNSVLVLEAIESRGQVEFP